MELQVQTLGAAGDGGAVALADDVFARDFNEPLVHQVVTAYMAAARAGTKAQKTRSEVRGGGAKPWRQKGTGRARAGTSRSPIWRSGGRAFAARPRDYSQKVNRKMYRAAMRAILSELVRQERLTVVEAFEIEEPRTRLARATLDRLGVAPRERVLILAETLADELVLALRNIPGVSMAEASAIDPVLLIACERVIATRGALTAIEAMLK